jgi:hypothetical protein
MSRLIKTVRITTLTGIVATSLLTSTGIAVPIVSEFGPASSKTVTYVDTKTRNVVLLSVGDRYALRTPITVALKEVHGEYVASFEEAELSRSGETALDAVDWLQSSIVTLYETLSKKHLKELGPLPKRQLQVLREYLVAEPDPKA